MDVERAAWVSFLWIVLTTVDAQNPGVQEYCDNDVFSPACGPNEVILIKSGIYGRMREGGCITGQHGFINCQTNARPYLDAVCSGRRQCSITVATLIPKDRQPCSKDLRSYLEVSHECVKVVNASKTYCENSEAVEVREQQGYLSSLVTMETGCGSLDSPWWVTVNPGQNITLTLLDFGTTQAAESEQVCHVFAVIKEQGVSPSSRTPTKTVCATTSREREILTSSTNRLEVRLVPAGDRSSRKLSHFLFRFQAVGCSNVLKPVNGWVNRTVDTAIVSCGGDNNRQYILTCRGNKWEAHGDYHNCSEALSVQARPLDGSRGFFNGSHGLSVIVILCIAVSVGLCILAAGLIYIKRRRHTPAPRPDMKRALPEVSYGPADGPGKPVSRPPFNHKTGDSTELYHSSENAYYRTWQMQRHTPQQMAPLPAVPSGGALGGHAQFAGVHAHAHAGPCPTHAQMSPESGGYQRSTQSASEHIYESPKFDRKDYSSDEYEVDGLNSEYFELDPETNSKMT